MSFQDVFVIIFSMFNIILDFSPKEDYRIVEYDKYADKEDDIFNTSFILVKMTKMGKFYKRNVVG